MPPVLSLQQLTRSYGALCAVDNLSFEVPEGSVFGILGPNGSGKTTLLAMTLDVLKPDAGSYTWFGKPGEAASRRQIGSLLETPNFYPYLSARDNLRLCAIIRGCDAADADRVLEVTGLAERSGSLFKHFSLGMKQRLALAASLLGRPPVIVLDEPANGLDPQGIADIRHLIKGLGEAGTTVIMASHLLDEVEKVCTHVAILNRGKLLAAGPVSEVLVPEDAVEIDAGDRELLKRLLKGHPGVRFLRPAADNRLEAVLEQGLDAGGLNRYLFEQGCVLTHLAEKRKSLELAFLELTRPGGKKPGISS